MALDQSLVAIAVVEGDDVMIYGPIQEDGARIRIDGFDFATPKEAYEFAASFDAQQQNQPTPKVYCPADFDQPRLSTT